MIRQCVYQKKRICTLLTVSNIDQTRTGSQNTRCYRHSRSNQAVQGGSHDSGSSNYQGGSYENGSESGHSRPRIRCLGSVAAAVVGLVAASSSVEPPTRSQLDYLDHLYETGQLDELVNGLRYFSEWETVELLWRRARAEWAWNKSIKFATGGYQARRLQECMDLIDKAMELDNTVSNVYLVKAVLVKAQCQMAGSPGPQIAGMIEMGSLLETALELDPDNGAAAQLLSMWHFEVAQIGWLQRKVFGLWGSVPEGNLQTALRLAWTAQELHQTVRNLLLLAKIYFVLGDVDKSKRYVEMSLEVPCTSQDDVEAVEEATKLMKQLGS